MRRLSQASSPGDREADDFAEDIGECKRDQRLQQGNRRNLMCAPIRASKRQPPSVMSLRVQGHAARRDEQSVPVDGVLSGTFVPPRNRCCLLFACTGMS